MVCDVQFQITIFKESFTRKKFAQKKKIISYTRKEKVYKIVYCISPRYSTLIIHIVGRLLVDGLYIQLHFSQLLLVRSKIHTNIRWKIPSPQTHLPLVLLNEMPKISLIILAYIITRVNGRSTGAQEASKSWGGGQALRGNFRMNRAPKKIFPEMLPTGGGGIISKTVPG